MSSRACERIRYCSQFSVSSQRVRWNRGLPAGAGLGVLQVLMPVKRNSGDPTGLKQFVLVDHVDLGRCSVNGILAKP